MVTKAWKHWVEGLVSLTLSEISLALTTGNNIEMEISIKHKECQWG
jgi:hypothetical protein